MICARSQDGSISKVLWIGRKHSAYLGRSIFSAAYSSSSPERTESTPGGRTCWASSTNLIAQRGAKGDGLTITQFPATKAGASFQTINDNGKLKSEGLDGVAQTTGKMATHFQGVIAAHWENDENDENF